MRVEVTVGNHRSVSIDLEGAVAGSKFTMVFGGYWAIPMRKAVDLSMAKFAQSVCITF